MAVEAVVERTARGSVLPIVRNDEQEYPRECCYYCLPAASYSNISQDNATEMRNIQNKLGKASNKSLRKPK